MVGVKDRVKLLVGGSVARVKPLSFLFLELLEGSSGI